MTLDPLHNAVRPDIADVRLAEHVFAPHYAAPMARAVLHATTLRTARDADSAPLIELAHGDRFEVLEIAGALAWGIAVDRGIVGYVAAEAIEGLGA